MQSPTSASKGQHLTRVTCALALVSSLAIYQRAVVANPLTIAQSHWEAIASENLNRTTTLYSPDAILVWNDGHGSQTYHGAEIRQAWQQFFREYQIRDYQIAKIFSRERLSQRTLGAKIAINAELDRGSDKVFSITYQLHLDDQGKIIHEVWQTSPELTI